MEKYGVDESDADTKTAQERPTTCPTCNAPLKAVEETNVLVCPTCGTKPFEGPRP